MTEGIIQQILNKEIKRYEEYAIFNSWNTNRFNQDIVIRDLQSIRTQLIEKIKKEAELNWFATYQVHDFTKAIIGDNE